MCPQKAVSLQCRGYRHFAQLQHIEGLTYVKAFIQICLTKLVHIISMRLSIPIIFFEW